MDRLDGRVVPRHLSPALRRLGALELELAGQLGNGRLHLQTSGGGAGVSIRAGG